MPRRSPPVLPDNALSLLYRGALPEILRMIAQQLDEGSVEAEHFSARVGQGSFDLQATITILGQRPSSTPRTNYPGA